MITIIDVDPGNVCGIAILEPDFTFNSNELSPMMTTRVVERVINERTRCLIACERYDINGKKVLTQQLEALYTIGALRHIAAQYDVTFLLQNRSDAKKVTDYTLKNFGWYKKTKDGHANDAARHVCQTLLTHYPARYLELLDRI